MKNLNLKKSSFILFFFTVAFAVAFTENCGNRGEEKIKQNAYDVGTLANLSLVTVKRPTEKQIPQGITTDGDNVYVTDFFNHAVLCISLKTSKITNFAGVYGISGFRDGDAGAALFNRPFGITNHAGYLYVSDFGNSVIRKISIQTGRVTTFAGQPGIAGQTNGDSSKALFRRPMGVATDGHFLFVADTGNSTIRKIDLNSGFVEVIAGMSGVAGITDGIGNRAQFNTPKGVATDGKFVYVADTLNGTIRKVDIETKEVITLAGRNFQPGGEDGTGTDAGLNNPEGVTMMNGVLYVADSGNNKIRMISPETGEVLTIAGKHFFESACPVLNLYHKLMANRPSVTSAEYADGVGLQSRFKNPCGIASDGKRLFVIDTDNRKIRTLSRVN